MKKHYYIILLGCLLCCFYSCKNNKEETFRVYEAGSIYSRPENIPLTSFAKTIQRIPLETNENILMDYIMDVIDTGDLLFILHENRCSVFDKNGKYLYDISKKGEGPHEHLSIWDIFVQDNKIALHDRTGKKLRFFTFDGKFEKEIPLPSMFNTVKLISENSYVGYKENLTGDQLPRLIFFNETAVLDTFNHPRLYPKTDMPVMYLGEGYIFASPSGFHLKEMFNDTIFTFLPDLSIEPRLVLDLGKYKVIPEMRYSITDPMKSLFEEKAWVMINGENKDYLFFNAMIKQQYTTFYVDKKKEEIHNVLFSYPDDFEWEGHFIPRFMSEDKKRIIGYEEEEEGDNNPTLIIATLLN